jgi:hypothetical protein
MSVRYAAPRFYIMPVAALWQANKEVMGQVSTHYLTLSINDNKPTTKS